MFITFEGGEGSGKTTQIELLTERLERYRMRVLQTREPGGTPLGDAIRDLLLDKRSRIEPAAEMLLYSASRAQLVADVIRPFLERGGVVLCDRYADSTLAYQGYGRGLDLITLRQVTALATGNLKPDLTFYLDIDPALGLERRSETGHINRLDALSVEFHERVRAGYLALIAMEPTRWVRIDADQPLAVVQGTIASVVAERLAERGMLPYGMG